MYYDVFQSLCNSRKVKPVDVSRATGISTATLTSWKKGVYTPKAEKLQLIADYFGVSLEYLTTGQQPEQYYLNPETAAIAQAVYDDPDLRVLFDAARDADPKNIQLAAEMLRRFKETNQDG